MMLFVLVIIPLCFMISFTEKDNGCKLWGIRFPLIAGLAAGLVVVAARLMVQVVFPLGYSWGESGIWFALLDWILPLSVSVLAIFLFRANVFGGEAGRPGKAVQAFFLPIFTLLLWVRMAERINQLEIQDLFLYPALLAGLFLACPAAIQGCIRRADAIGAALAGGAFLVCAVLIQTFSHMNWHLGALLMVGPALAFLFAGSKGQQFLARRSQATGPVPAGPVDGQ